MSRMCACACLSYLLVFDTQHGGNASACLPIVKASPRLFRTLFNDDLVKFPKEHRNKNTAKKNCGPLSLTESNCDF